LVLPETSLITEVTFAESASLAVFVIKSVNTDSLTLLPTFSKLGQDPVFFHSDQPHINLLKPTEFSIAE
jgi:hypothetical protein